MIDEDKKPQLYFFVQDIFFICKAQLFSCVRQGVWILIANFHPKLVINFHPKQLSDQEVCVLIFVADRRKERSKP